MNELDSATGPGDAGAHSRKADFGQTCHRENYMMRLIKVSGFLLALLVATPSAQSEEAGDAVVTIAGEAFQYSLNAKQSDWWGSADYATINIWLSAATEDAKSKYPGLTISFSYSAGDISEAETRLMKMSADGAILRLYGEPEAGDLSIEASSFIVNGDEVTITGTFETDFGSSENAGRNIDLSDPTSATGEFSVTLGPVK